MGDPTGIALADALKKNGTLTDLRLSSNQFGDATAQAFADALQQNSAIAFLDLEDNKLSEESEDKLKAAWGDREGNIYLGIRLRYH